MKRVFFLLLLINTTVFSQNASLNVQLSLNDKWNLNNYVWSQTHTAKAKDDKPPLDFDAIDAWDYLDHTRLSISADGKYFVYGTFRGSLFCKQQEVLTIQSTTSLWKKSYLAAKPGFFSIDNKQYIFKYNDDLCFLQTGTDHVRNIKQVATYKQSTNDTTEWIAYQLKNNETTLVLENLSSGKEKIFNDVASYNFDETGKWLACQLKNDKKELIIYNLKLGVERRFQFVNSYAFSGNGGSLVIETAANQSNARIEIQYLVLPYGKINTIWSTTEKSISISNYNLDNSGKQLVLTVKKSSGNESDYSIWYYKAGMDKAVIKVNNRSADLDENFSIHGPASFTASGRYIQFAVQKAPSYFYPDSDAIMVDVWNYKDLVLKSTQSKKLGISNAYKLVINPEANQIIQLEKESEHLILLKGDFAVVQKSIGNISDRFWEKDYKKDSIWMISLKDGVRHLLPVTAANMVWFSPGGSYLVYFDSEHGCHYFSFDLLTGKQVKVSADIPNWKLGYEDQFIRSIEKPITGCGIAGWINDAAILVYDNYDIWQLDLTGKVASINVTNGYGRKHKTLLSLINCDRFATSDLIFKENDILLLMAFNTQNKYNGFYKKTLASPQEPDLLSIGPYFFKLLMPLDGFTYGMKPIRASKANVWIVSRETAKEAPNYFLTTDFKIYKPLTNFQLQKSYNWLTTELHSFKQIDGTISQGVLYKPENFDPSKKYPVIISFYSDMSSRLYQFPAPQFMTHAAIFSRPAWMVSHGYLVFLPDIYFTRGQWGPSTVNTVVGAANYLIKLPYVDSKRLGACGHSNSGRFGYYLLTHSNSFAAISVSSGTTNIISNGLAMDADGSSRLEWAEWGSFGTGLGSLWKNKDSWLDHSSILHADKVTTPLLIFENKKDPSFLQGFEMFTALRRLEKPSWWLQYDKGGHTLESQSDNSNVMKDYTIRYTQFYDHFLKCAPPPQWITRGIPSTLKGIENGLKLDEYGKCSKNCRICIGIR